jgi:hypothetical protein
MTRKINQKDYTHYLIGYRNNEPVIISGWSYVEDARDAKKEWPELRSSVWSKAGAKRTGLDPDDNSNWTPSREAGGVKDSYTDLGADLAGGSDFDKPLWAQRRMSEGYLQDQHVYSPGDNLDNADEKTLMRIVLAGPHSKWGANTPREISHYASLALSAQGFRRAGSIDYAMAVEQKMEELYSILPKKLRW